MISAAFLCFSWPVGLQVMALWEPAWLHQRSLANHCNCAVLKPPSPTSGLNREIFENARVKRGGVGVQREMWDHRASLTRRRTEKQPGSRGTRPSPQKENNYGCKRRYCAESRSIVATFRWCWGRCISVTAGESARYQLVAGGTRWSSNTGRLPPFHPALLGVRLLTYSPLLPISNPLIHTELAAGPAFVYSWLYPHSPGCTVMFSSVMWRIPLFSSRLDISGDEDNKDTINTWCWFDFARHRWGNLWIWFGNAASLILLPVSRMKSLGFFAFIVRYSSKSRVHPWHVKGLLASPSYAASARNTLDMISAFAIYPNSPVPCAHKWFELFRERFFFLPWVFHCLKHASPSRADLCFSLGGK